MCVKTRLYATEHTLSEATSTWKAEEIFRKLKFLFVISEKSSQLVSREQNTNWSECNYGIWKNQVISMVLAQQARSFIQQSMKINRCCHLGGIFVFGEGKFYFFQRFLIGFFCADNFAFSCCYIVKLPLSCFRIIYQLDFDKT